MDQKWSIIIAILSAIGGGLITEVFRWAVSRKSSNISDAQKIVLAAQQVIGAYDLLTEELRTQIKTLEQKLGHAEQSISALQEENEALARQVEKLKIIYQSRRKGDR